jgi:hypothetical protein
VNYSLAEFTYILNDSFEIEECWVKVHQKILEKVGLVRLR